jgi:hypothetical protein
MHAGKRVVLVLLGAALLCGVVAVNSSATRLSVSERSFKDVWTPLTAGLVPNMEVEEEVEEVLISCNVTMEGSLHSGTIAKVARSLIGYVARATVDARSCSEARGMGGTFTFLSGTLPWHITYTGFSGTLPLINDVRVSFIGMALGISSLLLNCLTASTVANPAGWVLTREPRGAISGFGADAGIILPTPTGFGCERWHAVYFGTGRLTRPDGVTLLTLRLM